MSLKKNGEMQVETGMSRRGSILGPKSEELLEAPWSAGHVPHVNECSRGRG
jgi:hypothetical protein